MAKQIADEMVAEPELDPEKIVEKNPNYQPIANADQIDALVDRVLSDPQSAQSIVDFKAGKEKALAYLVGQVMKLSQGKASPPLVTELLRSKLAK